MNNELPPEQQLLPNIGKKIAILADPEHAESEYGLAHAFLSWLSDFTGWQKEWPSALYLLSAGNRLLALASDEVSSETAEASEAFFLRAEVRSGEGKAAELCLHRPKDGEERAAAVLQVLAEGFAAHLRYLENLRDRDSQLQISSEKLKESGKRDALFEAAKRLHAMIDVDSVLSEIMQSLKAIYPDEESELYLSQDNHSSKISVKTLSFHGTEQDICLRAFVEGRPISSGDLFGDAAGCRELAVPLSGKQGVYGVAKITSERKSLHQSDLKYISILMESAGIAFENARLYQQSNTLIQELRLINEITKRLSQSLKLSDIFAYASTELIKIFSADFCCVLQYDPELQKFVVQASNVPLFSQEYFASDYGFSGHINQSKEPVIVSDYNQSKIESRFMGDTGSRSLIASPIVVNAEVVGVVMITHRSPNYFSYENFKLLQVLAGHIGLAITNASLHAEVRRMVITDQLTKLHSRHYLDEEINNRQKKDFCGSLIMVDIDNFKNVNDTFGHQVGDKILMQVSRIILSCIRESDIAARWGGEELAVYLPQATKEQTYRVAERIRNRVYTETGPQVSVSCGISDWNWEDEKVSVEHLFYQADMALYEAKYSGKNTIKLSMPDLDRQDRETTSG